MNVIAAHPNLPVLAVSGIDHEIKLMTLQQNERTQSSQKVLSGEELQRTHRYNRGTLLLWESLPTMFTDSDEGSSENENESSHASSEEELLDEESNATEENNESSE